MFVNFGVGALHKKLSRNGVLWKSAQCQENIKVIIETLIVFSAHFIRFWSNLSQDMSTDLYWVTMSYVTLAAFTAINLRVKLNLYSYFPHLLSYLD